MDLDALRAELAAEVPCQCIDAYRERGLVAPECDHHAAMAWFDERVPPLLGASGQP